MGGDAPVPSRALTWGAVPRGLGAGVLVRHALQGRQGQVQAAVGAGPEGAQAVTIQVCVALRRWCQGSGLRPTQRSMVSPGPSPGDPPPGAGGPHAEAASLDSVRIGGLPKTPSLGQEGEGPRRGLCSQ